MGFGLILGAIGVGTSIYKGIKNSKDSSKAAAKRNRFLNQELSDLKEAESALRSDFAAQGEDLRDRYGNRVESLLDRIGNQLSNNTREYQAAGSKTGFEYSGSAYNAFTNAKGSIFDALSSDRSALFDRLEAQQDELSTLEAKELASIKERRSDINQEIELNNQVKKSKFLGLF